MIDATRDVCLLPSRHTSFFRLATALIALRVGVATLVDAVITSALLLYRPPGVGATAWSRSSPVFSRDIRAIVADCTTAESTADVRRVSNFMTRRSSPCSTQQQRSSAMHGSHHRFSGPQHPRAYERRLLGFFARTLLS